jgi:hypothetical protein
MGYLPGMGSVKSLRSLRRAARAAVASLISGEADKFRRRSRSSVALSPVIEALEERRLFTVHTLLDFFTDASSGAGNGGDPVQLATGTLVLNTTDIHSSGFGAPWGVTRSWKCLKGS